jgi:hypothetical protein
MPCHNKLEEYLTAYLDGGGLRGNPKGPLFASASSPVRLQRQFSRRRSF